MSDPANPREVSRLMRLMAAPDAGSRARAKQRLLDLELENRVP